MISVLYSSLFGLIAGIVYGIGYFFRMLTNFNKIFTVLVDILVTIIAGILFVYCMFVINDGIIRVYNVISFFLGFAIERISIGNLFANISSLLYNKFAIGRKSHGRKLCKTPNPQE